MLVQLQEMFGSIGTHFLADAEGTAMEGIVGDLLAIGIGQLIAGPYRLRRDSEAVDVPFQVMHDFAIKLRQRCSFLVQERAQRQTRFFLGFRIGVAMLDEDVLFQLFFGVIDIAGLDFQHRQLIASAVREAGPPFYTGLVGGFGSLDIVQLAARLAQQEQAFAQPINIVLLSFDDFPQFVRSAWIIVSLVGADSTEPKMFFAFAFLGEEFGSFGMGLGSLAEQFIGGSLFFLARFFLLGRAGAFPDNLGPFAMQLSTAQLGLGGIRHTFVQLRSTDSQVEAI